MLKPITISDESIDLEMIKEVGIRGEYLTHSNALNLFRNEHFETTLFNRLGYNEWEATGGQSFFERAVEIVANLLKLLQASLRDLYSKRLNCLSLHI